MLSLQDSASAGFQVGLARGDGKARSHLRGSDIFSTLDDGGYRFVDGGIWANNPVMIGLTEALTSFSAPRERIRILSLGCGSAPKQVGRLKTMLGGKVFWSDVIYAAMRLQSMSALGHAYLLIGLTPLRGWMLPKRWED